MNDDFESCPKCGRTVAGNHEACAACGWVLHRPGDMLTADEARQMADEILRTGQLIDAGWTRIAERLHRFDDAKGYAALGFSSLSEWIEQTPLRLTAGRGIRLLRVYRFFVVEHGLEEDDVADVPPSRLARLKKPVQDGRLTVTDAVEEARVFTEHELGRHYHQTSNPATRPSAVVNALKTLKQTRLPGMEDRRLVVVPIVDRDYDQLVADHILTERDDGLVELAIPALKETA